MLLKIAKILLFIPLSSGCVTMHKMQLLFSDNPIPKTPANIAAGKAVYTENCTRCHGTKGLNDGPQAPAGTAKIAGFVDQGDGITAMQITYGKGDYMPAFKDQLSEKQIYQVIRYLRTLKPK